MSIAKCVLSQRVFNSPSTLDAIPLFWVDTVPSNPTRPDFEKCVFVSMLPFWEILGAVWGYRSRLNYSTRSTTFFFKPSNANRKYLTSWNLNIYRELIYAHSQNILYFKHHQKGWMLISVNWCNVLCRNNCINMHHSISCDNAAHFSLVRSCGYLNYYFQCNLH